MIDSTRTAAGDPAVPATARTAVAAALRDLVADGTLTEPQATRVLTRLSDLPAQAASPSGSSRPSRNGQLAEIAGYAGGALLLGAAALFLTGGWRDLGETARVALLGALTVLLLVAGALVARTSGVSAGELGRQRDSARRRLVSVLWTFAAASAAGAAGLGVAGWELVAASTAGLVVGAATFALVPSAVGQLGVWLASIGLVTGVIAEGGNEPGAAPYAVALVALGAGWCALGLTGVMRDRGVALMLGAGIALVGAQLPVFGGDLQWLGYALTAVVAVGGFAGYLVTRSWSVLGVGVLATTLVVPEALHDWTDGSVSASGSLLVAGLTLLAASAAGLRLRREIG